MKKIVEKKSINYILNIIRHKHNFSICNMRTYIKLTLVFFITLSLHIDSNAQDIKKNGDVKMKQWSLGRVNFNLPKYFKIINRNHSIYHVEVNTIPINESTADIIWENRLKKIKTINSLAVEGDKSINFIESDTDFPIVIYRENPSMPNLITMETQKNLHKHILTLKFQGKSGKEENIKKLFSITSGGYSAESPYGFNIGLGSLNSKPSRNEFASANFKNDKNLDVKISIKTAGTYLTKHPLDDIEFEIKGLANEGVSLKVIKDEVRTVAGFKGNEGIISLDDGKENSQFRYTWFTPGETADSFRPEILIKVHGPLEDIDSFKTIWEDILSSFEIRTEN